MDHSCSSDKMTESSVTTQKPDSEEEPTDITIYVSCLMGNKQRNAARVCPAFTRYGFLGDGNFTFSDKLHLDGQ